jgi:hypothetical protein
MITKNSIQLDLSNLAALQEESANYAGDLDDLINVATQQLTDAEQNLAGLESAISSGTGAEELETIAQNIRTLRTGLELQNNIQEDLISERDLARDAYQAILKKETEVRNTVQTANLITLAGSAVPPVSATHSTSYIYTIIVAGLGFLVGMLVIFRNQIRRFMNSDSASH